MICRSILRALCVLPWFLSLPACVTTQLKGESDDMVFPVLRGQFDLGQHSVILAV